ncbi:tripartite tricarboxylate transporter permease [Evansella sp. LMS18]|uniref:tripartite tricarboxylate transporter permease n=1 Tax=Evansella sp. LMS18 TaxID=2924033 RepID=UPI0020D05D7F|nr:tripartite tricarboxylate transporter permease [Evansella sp. LMS18]UTR12053.1 tripartite tricarboxylate transporter permease [Evansella sp. LMS18]
MIDFTALSDGLNLLFTPHAFFFMVLGLIIGVILGSIPGLSGSLGIAVLLPTTYYMDPVTAVLFLSALLTGSIYAGGVTAVTLNIPGSPGAVATTLDGYQMTKKGQQNRALGIGLGSSVIGCLFGYLMVLFFLEPIGKLVLSFGSVEILALTFFALSVISVIDGSVVKTLIAGTVGLLIGTIGATAFGRPRGTFGVPELYEGVQLITVLIGLLALSEMFFLIQRKFVVEENNNQTDKSMKDILLGLKESLKYKINMIRSGAIGLIIGLMPAAGSTVASLVSYGQARSWTKSDKVRKHFGKGEPNGIVAAESANNASEGGSMATMLTFGIPGSGATAILMVALMIHGLSPGPYLIRDHLDITYAIIFGNIIQSILLLGLGLLFIYYFSKVVLVPTKILTPIIVVLCFLGALSVRGLMIDVVLAALFGLIGYIFRRLEYPVVALILGIILGPTLDAEFTRTLLIYENNPLAVFERPAFLVIFFMTILMIVITFIKNIKQRQEERV